MNKNFIKEIIDNNMDKMPLSFYDLEIKKDAKQLSGYGKITSSKEFKDSNFSIYKFYKAITRF